MRVLLQRVKNASVQVNGEIIGAISAGILVLLGISAEDSEEDIVYLTKKIQNLRIFNDENGKMNLSLMDVGGELLIVSQFTLFANTKKGNRPSYTRSASPEIAIPLYGQFIETLKDGGIKVETGEFGADMKVELLNDGPVSIWIDSKEKNY